MRKLFLLVFLFLTSISCVAKHSAYKSYKRRSKNIRKCYPSCSVSYTYNVQTTIMQYNIYYIYGRDTILLDTKMFQNREATFVLKELNSDFR